MPGSQGYAGGRRPMSANRIQDEGRRLMPDPEPMWTLDDLKNLPRRPGFRYFVHGFVLPPVFLPSPTDFGNGYYAFEATVAGIESAAAWARKRVRRLGGTPVVELVSIEEMEYARLSRLELDLAHPADQFQWSQLVSWYRQRNPGPGPGDAHDVIAGPLATQRKSTWAPVQGRPDQYRFLYYLRPKLQVMLRAPA
jgi:hypothetical protein